MDRRKLIAWLALSILVVFLAAIVLLPHAEQQAGKQTTAATPSDRLELEAFLGELKRTWQPWAKTKLLAKANASVDRFKGPLLDLLQEPEPNPLRLQAIRLAAELELTHCRGAIAHLATKGPEDMRAEAVVAVERLGRWNQTELLDLLRNTAPGVICAALEVCSKRSDRPLAEILLLLSHDDLGVRQAATKAIPRELNANELKNLMIVARSVADDQRLPMVQAVGRTKRVPEVEDFLLEQLVSRDPSIRLAALDALASDTSGPLHRPATVWNFVLNTDCDLNERARAFVCLEKTASFDAAQVREELPRLHPYLSYFAARCLIRGGDKQGITALIALVETPRDRFDLDARRTDAVLYAARRLLTDLSRIAPQSDPDAWRQWCQKLTTVKPRRLGSPPLDLRPASIGTASSPR